MPPKSGGHYGILYPQKYLAKHSRLVVAGVKTNAPTQAIEAVFYPVFSNRPWRYANPLYYFTLAGIIRKESIQVIYLDHPYLFWMAWLLCKRFKLPLVIRSHNVEYLRFKNLGKWWWPLLQWYETKAHRFATWVCCVTQEERTIIQKDIGTPNTHVIDLPYGTELYAAPNDKAICKQHVCTKHGLHADTKIILFNGSLSYGPNRQALDKILDVINPALLKESLNYCILICGNKLPPEYDELKAYRSQHIIFAGFVEDVSVYFKAADLFLNPVLGGGGIKTKLVEALAFSTQSISTTDGATGLYPAYTGDMLRIVPDNDWKSFIQETIHCLNASDTPSTPLSFYDYYNWDYNMKQLARRLEDRP